MCSAVRIDPEDVDGSLGFDLEQIVEVLGDQSRLSWTVTNAYVLAERPGTGDPWTYSPPDVSLAWSEIVQMAKTVVQVIDGTFTGRSTEGPELLVCAVDSTYWVVWTEDSDVIERVRQSFRHVRPWPAPPESDGGSRRASG